MSNRMIKKCYFCTGTGKIKYFYEGKFITQKCPNCRGIGTVDENALPIIIDIIRDIFNKKIRSLQHYCDHGSLSSCENCGMTDYTSISNLKDVYQEISKIGIKDINKKIDKKKENA